MVSNLDIAHATTHAVCYVCVMMREMMVCIHNHHHPTSPHNRQYMHAFVQELHAHTHKKKCEHICAIICTFSGGNVLYKHAGNMFRATFYIVSIECERRACYVRDTRAGDRDIFHAYFVCFQVFFSLHRASYNTMARSRSRSLSMCLCTHV